MRLKKLKAGQHGASLQVLLVVLPAVGTLDNDHNHVSLVSYIKYLNNLA